ncbi:MAG TPA: rRNA small subunit methyltransferase 1 [Candidatus Latescibacteria bacterium]|nr:rRNA small subunit methyltransferase 1 [Candidatus Latescibacterota bacterium]
MPPAGGEDVALVSDAGTPGISDPAYYLVVKAVEEGIEVVPVPGPTAFVAALVVSGLPTDRFTFEGFLPHRASRRRKRLEELREESRTMIFYESPHRISETLKDVLEILGDRRASLSRELTKKHEETRRGRISELLESCRLRPPRGELVLVVEGAGRDV